MVKNYRGVNSSYGKDRTLIVKEGRAGHFVPPTSSLPEWFHPGYYDTADQIYLKLRRPPSASAKVPFKNSGRYPSEEDDMEKTRKRILKSRLNFIPTASLAGSHAPTDSLQMSTSQYHDSSTEAGGGLEGISPDYFYYSIYSTRSPSPGYASPGKCTRPHSQFTETGLFNPSNPWTRSSSTSTINSPVHHGNVSSPRTIYLSSSSCSSLPSSHREGYASVDELNSQYFDQQSPATYRSSLSSLHSSTNPTSMYSDSLATDHDVSLTTVDSLLIKAATRQRNRYKVPDYTLGALDQQSISKLVIPPMEFPELDAEINSLANPSRPLTGAGASAASLPLGTKMAPISSSLPSSAVLNSMNRNMKEKEKEKQQLESLYAVTTAAIPLPAATINLSSSGLNPEISLGTTGGGEDRGDGIATNPNSLQRRHKKEKGIQRNKANQTLESIKSSLSISKSSVVLNEEIPFDRKMTGYINQWTRERNFVETDLMRPRQCICRYSIDEKTKKKKYEEGAVSGDDDESLFLSLEMTNDEERSLGEGEEGDQSLRYLDSDGDDFTELTAEDSSVFSA